jgi:hypothetical protein
MVGTAAVIFLGAFSIRAANAAVKAANVRLSAATAPRIALIGL